MRFNLGHDSSFPVTIREWIEAHFAAMPRNADPVIIELGAHKGEDTAWLRKVHPRVVVHAFEPDPPKALPQWKRVHWHEQAVGAHEGTVDWWRSTTRDGGRPYRKSSSMLPPDLHLERHPEVRFEGEPRRVSCTTLDFFARQRLTPGLTSALHVDLLWMDVQGAEALVFEGGRGMLARTDWLYTEATVEAMYKRAPTRAEIVDMLPGWTVEREWPDDILLKRTR